MRYTSQSEAAGGDPERIGILLVNSGTPVAATAAAVRAFLARFLADPRVVELPRLLWLPVLWGAILPLRPRRVARKYQLIWTATGSPLRELSEQLRQELSGVLAQRMLAPVSIEVGMLYSPPDVRGALERLRAGGARRVLVLPLFPQYCGATTGAAFDQVSSELGHWRALPDLQFVADYHDRPGYIEALRAGVVAHWERRGRSAHLLISFHGIPEDYVQRGDPYLRQCQATARLLADELRLPEGEWSVSFQSRFGPRNWLQPYTASVLAAMPARGVREVAVVCPGFAVDCLETLEEIAVENRDVFLRAGGERYEYVPALNAGSAHARCLADLISERCQAWTQAANAAPVGRGAAA